jgi:hypothetical protein
VLQRHASPKHTLRAPLKLGGALLIIHIAASSDSGIHRLARHVTYCDDDGVGSRENRMGGTQQARLACHDRSLLEYCLLTRGMARCGHVCATLGVSLTVVGITRHKPQARARTHFRHETDVYWQLDHGNRFNESSQSMATLEIMHTSQHTAERGPCGWTCGVTHSPSGGA